MRSQSALLSFLSLSLLSTSTLVSAKQKVLIYTRTDGFRHDSIPDSIEVIKQLGKDNGFDTVATEDKEKFNDYDWVAQFDALMFVSASGDFLGTKGAANMRKYIENGGGFMGVHEACDAMYTTPWYGRLIGGTFNGHPFAQEATYHVHHRSHPSVAHLGKTWKHFDEIYNYISDWSALGMKVVLTVDDSSYINAPSQSELDSTMGGSHAIAWYKEGSLLTQPKHTQLVDRLMNIAEDVEKGIQGKGGEGRSFYTGLGHSSETWNTNVFQKHIMGGLQWVLDSPTISSATADMPDWAPGTKYVRTAEDKAASSASVAAEASSSRAAEAAAASNGTGDDETEDDAPSMTTSFVNPAASSLAAAVGLARLPNSASDLSKPLTAALLLVVGVAGAGLAL